MNELQTIEEEFSSLVAGNEGELLEVYSTENMLAAARLIAAASLERAETRGAHYRSDFPASDDQAWLRNTVMKQSNGKIHITLEDNR